MTTRRIAEAGLKTLFILSLTTMALSGCASNTHPPQPSHAPAPSAGHDTRSTNQHDENCTTDHDGNRYCDSVSTGRRQEDDHH